MALVEPAHRRHDADRALGTGQGRPKCGTSANDLGQAGGLEVAIERDATGRDRPRWAIGLATTEHLIEDRVVHPDGLRRSREGARSDIARS